MGKPVAGTYVAMIPEFPHFSLLKESDVKARFKEFTHSYRGKGRKIVRSGTPYHEILECAQEEQVDLIIVGARGLSNVERLFPGSTGEKVARNADRPVLIVHPKSAEVRIKKYWCQ